MATWPSWNNSSATSNSTSTSTSAFGDVWYSWIGATGDIIRTPVHDPWTIWDNAATSAATDTTWHRWDEQSAIDNRRYTQQYAMQQEHAMRQASRQQRSLRHQAQYNQQYQQMQQEYIKPGKPYIFYEEPEVDFITAHYRKMQTKINMAWRDHLAEQLKLEKEAAENTAKALLLDLTSQKEFDLYEKTGKLLVKGRKHSYILCKNGIVTTILNEKKKAVKGMCVHLNYTDKNKCPATDNVIALKFHIEQEEKKFLKTANHHSHRIASPMEEDFLEAVNQ